MVVLKVKFGKRRTEHELIIDNPRIDLREKIKEVVKLQVPKNNLIISKEGNAQVPYNEAELLRSLRHGDTLYVTIQGFEIGDFICTNEELGNGSFSQVYRGIHKQTDKPVAIKVIDSKLLHSPKAREYHERERMIMSSIKHVNIVELMDVLEKEEPGDGVYYYFIMELCQGGSLDSHIKKKPFTELQTKRLLKQLADAFKYLHSKNIVHRDLKPQNILLSSTEIDEALLKICDFGFARYFRNNSNDSQVENEMILSHPITPLYAAPDLIAMNPYDDKCDLWSIGAIMFEMLAGEPLFKARSFQELYQAHARPNFINLPPHVKISSECHSLLFRLLEKDGSKRITWEEFFSHPFLSDVSQRKIYCVATGEEFKVEITEETNIRSMKVALVDYSKIPFEDQLILLEGGLELSNDTFLTTSGALFDSKNSIYLFNKNDADQNAYTVTPVHPILVEIRNIPLDVSVDDLPIKSLLETQHQFTNLMLNQKEYYGACLIACDKLKTSLPFISVLMKGLRVAIENLLLEQKDMIEEYSTLQSVFERQIMTSKGILENFETVLQKMEQTPLHQVLIKDNRKTLLDAFDSVQLRSDYSKFKEINRDLKIFLMDFQNTLRNIESDVPKPTEHLAQHLKALTKSKEYCRYVESFLQVVSKDQSTVTREISNARRAIKDGRPRIDASECFAEMLSNCRAQFEKTQEYYNAININMINSIEYQNSMQKQLQSVFTLRKKITQLAKELPEKRNSLRISQQLVQDLGKILLIPQAYESYIQEMSRRRSFQETIANKGTIAVGFFGNAINEERLRLKLFKSGAGSLLPPDIFPGCDVEEQNPVDIKIPEVTAPAIVVENRRIVDLLGSDFANIVKEDENNAELKRENNKLRADLVEALASKKNDDMSDFLNQITVLKDKLAQATETKNQFFEEYEKRFTNYKQQIKDYEEIVKTITAQLNRPEGSISQDQVQKKLEQHEISLVEKQRVIDHLREGMIQFAEKLKKEETLRRSAEEALTNLKSQMEHSSKRIEELEKENNVFQADSKKEEELISMVSKYKEESESFQAKFQKALKHTSLVECPVCEIFCSQSGIHEHVNGHFNHNVQ